jgi:glycosyltransferase involved in cell wall biosynthesis
VSPAVTFGLPVFNGERYLAEALRSIQEQDLEDIEIVVSDNGSTDGTEEIARTAADHDHRIRYLRSPVNRGGAWNYQRVAALAAAPLFSWMAADDVKGSAFARRCVEALDDAGGEYVFACPRTRLIDADGIVFEHLNDDRMGMDATSAAVRVRNLLQAQASHVMYGVIRTSALRRTRGVRPRVGDDMILLVELLCQGRMVLVDEDLFDQRRHREQFSQQGQNQVAWHAPDARARFAFPQTLLDLELYAAVAHTDLPFAEKARCWATIAPSWAFPRWRGVAGDVRTAMGVPARAG